jgi:hypothetical protein
VRRVLNKLHQPNSVLADIKKTETSRRLVTRQCLGRVLEVPGSNIGWVPVTTFSLFSSVSQVK